MRRWVLAAVVLATAGATVAVARGDVPCELVAQQPACQVALRPGPTEDALGLVSVSGIDVFPSDGELRLTTVAVDDDLGLVSWLRARTRDTGVEVVPRARIFPPGSDPAEVAERNAAAMSDSQLVSTIVALELLGYELHGEGALVAAVVEGAVTDELEAGDLIVAVDGRPVRESTDVVAEVRTRRPGDTFHLEVVGEDGTRREVSIRLGSAPEEPDTPYVGVLLTTQLELPVDVTIDAGVIGGPSAGLMFALSIVDLLGPEDLTGGRAIAGTGTVDRDGAVGAVGGVTQKLVGATSQRDGAPPASVFLVPRGNLAEARAAPVGSDVLLVPVDTVGDALAALDDLREGREPAGSLALAAGR